ncbi:MAG: pyridoxamine 5'-phosphate oxidase family protein [Treponema sp.]|nr:pyridoxamine 5'-phosphate oxidase family protein [Treponema sp.]
MNTIVAALKNAGVFFIATIDGEQSRVRPFGAVEEIDGKICFLTSNQKDVFKQIMAHPCVELSGMNKDGSWIRVSGKMARVADDKVAAAFLDLEPELKKMYSAGDGKVEILELQNATGTLYSFTDAPKAL